MTIKLEKYEIRKLMLACICEYHEFYQLAKDADDVEMRQAHMESALRFQSIHDKLKEQLEAKERQK